MTASILFQLGSQWCSGERNKYPELREGSIPISLVRYHHYCCCCYHYPLKIKLFGGWWDNPATQSTCYQTWWLEFNPQVPHDRRRKWFLQADLRICTKACVYPHIYMHTHKSVSAIILKMKPLFEDVLEEWTRFLRFKSWWRQEGREKEG